MRPRICTVHFQGSRRIARDKRKTGRHSVPTFISFSRLNWLLLCFRSEFRVVVQYALVAGDFFLPPGAQKSILLSGTTAIIFSRHVAVSGLPAGLPAHVDRIIFRRLYSLHFMRPRGCIIA